MELGNERLFCEALNYVRLPKMAATPIYYKNSGKYRPQNNWADDPENLHVWLVI